MDILTVQITQQYRFHLEGLLMLYQLQVKC